MGSRVCVLGALPGSLINFRKQLLVAMVEAGHTVFACAAQDDDTSRALGEATEQLGELGVRYHTYPLKRTGQNPLSDTRSLLALCRLLRRLRPEVLLTYTMKPVIYGSLAARVAGVPRCFAMITGLGLGLREEEEGRSSPRGILVRRLMRAALRRNERVFFQNPDDRDYFLSQRLLDDPRKPILINGSGVDLDHYPLTPPALSPPRFLLIARLLEDKGVRDYAAACRLVRQAHPSAEFRLVGPFDAHPLAIPKGDVEAWHTEGTPEHVGPVADVRPHLAWAGVYVLPSYREGTPRTVLEAMAMGRPIITTDAPGCRETVAHGRNGFLVPVRDPRALAAAMERFVRQPELIAGMGAESRRIAESKYDVHRVNRVILEAMGL